MTRFYVSREYLIYFCVFHNAKSNIFCVFALQNEQLCL